MWSSSTNACLTNSIRGEERETMMSRIDFEDFLSVCTATIVEDLAECSPRIWRQDGAARDLSFLCSVFRDWLFDSHPDSGVSSDELKDRAALVGVGLRLVMRQAFLATDRNNEK
jgi:hypothetical protein